LICWQQISEFKDSGATSVSFQLAIGHGKNRRRTAACHPTVACV